MKGIWKKWSLEKLLKYQQTKKVKCPLGTCAKMTTLSGGPKVEKGFQVKFMGLEHHDNPKPTKEKNCYPCNMPASMHFSSMAPPNVHVCHIRRLPQSKLFHVLLTLTTHSMYYHRAPQTPFFYITYCHLSWSLACLELHIRGEWKGMNGWEMHYGNGDGRWWGEWVLEALEGGYENGQWMWMVHELVRESERNG